MTVSPSLVAQASRMWDDRGAKPLTVQQAAIVRLIGPIDSKTRA